MEDNIFQQYRKVKDQITILEEKRKELELQVEALDEEDAQAYQTPYGVFKSLGRKSWKYSSKVKELAEAVSKQKKLEELDGTATLEKVTSYVSLIILKQDYPESPSAKEE